MYPFFTDIAGIRFDLMVIVRYHWYMRFDMLVIHRYHWHMWMRHAQQHWTVWRWHNWVEFKWMLLVWMALVGCYQSLQNMPVAVIKKRLWMLWRNSCLHISGNYSVISTVTSTSIRLTINNCRHCISHPVQGHLKCHAIHIAFT